MGKPPVENTSEKRRVNLQTYGFAEKEIKRREEQENVRGAPKKKPASSLETTETHQRKKIRKCRQKGTKKKQAKVKESKNIKRTMTRKD